MDNKKSLRKPLPNGIDMSMFGKIPPQARDIEEAVLGACMLERDAVHLALGILSPEMFYLEVHKDVFEVVKDLFNRGNPVDQLTVMDALRKNGKLESVGGAYYISELTNRVASGANVEYHSRIIHQKFIARELIRISAEVTRDAFEETTDVFELLENATRDFLRLDNVTGGGNLEPHHRVSLALAQIEKAMQNKFITGAPTGSDLLNSLTGGWQKQDLIIIGARPGVGKTGFIIWLARNAAEYMEKNLDGEDYHPYPTVLFSLEMSKTQIGLRELGMDNNVKYSKLRTGKISEDEFQQIVFGTSRIEDCPVYVDDDSRLTPTLLRSKLLKMQNEKKIGLAIIDYLNLMKVDGGKKMSRYEELSEVTREVKAVAKELNIPIIMLCQLNRSVETESKTDKRPQLHHLRDTGTVEEAADTVMLLYRPAYYMDKIPDFPKFNADNEPEDNAFYVNFAKHKQGATGEVRLFTEIEKNIFRDWGYIPPAPQQAKTPIRDITEPQKEEEFEKPLPF